VSVNPSWLLNSVSRPPALFGGHLLAFVFAVASR